jgi:hypothetical protein
MVLDHLRDILPSQGRLLSLEVAQGESTLHASTREVFWRGSKGGIRGLVQTLRLYHFAPTSRSWVYPGMGPSRDPSWSTQAPGAHGTALPTGNGHVHVPRCSPTHHLC